MGAEKFQNPIKTISRPVRAILKRSSGSPQNLMHPLGAMWVFWFRLQVYHNCFIISIKTMQYVYSIFYLDFCRFEIKQYIHVYVIMISVVCTNITEALIWCIYLFTQRNRARICAKEKCCQTRDLNICPIHALNHYKSLNGTQRNVSLLGIWTMALYQGTWMHNNSATSHDA